MGGKSSKSASASKKAKESEAKSGSPESRRDVQAWDTPSKLETAKLSQKAAMSASSSASDLVQMSPTSETKVEKVASQEDLLKMARGVEEEEEEVLTNVLNSPSESIERPSKPKAAFVLFDEEREARTDSAQSRSPIPGPGQMPEEKLMQLPEIKVAPKKLHDISNIIGNQTQMRGNTTPDYSGPAKGGGMQSGRAHLGSETPSPASYRNIGYVSSASATPEKGQPEDPSLGHDEFLQRTPEKGRGGGHQLLVGSPEYASAFDDSAADYGMNSNGLDNEQQPMTFSDKMQMQTASPAPQFESILDDTDESLMQAILDADA